MDANKKQPAPLSLDRWPEPRLKALQVVDLYRHAPAAAVFSFFGALLVFGVLIQIGDATRGTLWFLWATAVTFFRFSIILLYRRREAGSDPGHWGRLVLTANVLAGLQWGLLGTLLFPAGPAYAQIFVVMVIICFVAGSVTAYSAIPWGHHAMSIPSTFPTAIYVYFFSFDEPHWFAGIAALFFSLAIVYYSQKLHRHLATSFRLQLERDDLLALTAALNEKLARENKELAHRAAVRGAVVESARERAERLEALFERSPLALVECDGLGRILSCNAAAERLLGRRREALQGEPFASLLSASDTGWRTLEPGRLAESGTPVSVEIELAGSAGVPRRCEASVVALPASPGVRPGFGVVLAQCPEPAT